ncbi:hypothetical protein GS399_17930 [Pedobacter sp. HMF7647]|uniref:TfoX N-terminal domain-containing protein n=1 Tax=Hufsiella arboris TaxID=2695275 RepID=A0A7K1YE24_9SPHI|nr:TfoX/Sxy family protein [Hufsiella arboris]MXV52856.1 hypothetical protein [Hufsiella arboris]
MPYNEQLAARVREGLASRVEDVTEKNMFGGICFMVNDKMCVCISRDDLLCRIGAKRVAEMAGRMGVKQMTMGERPMKDFVYVEKEQIQSAKELDYWVGLALEFNLIAKASKKR